MTFAINPNTFSHGAGISDGTDPPQTRPSGKLCMRLASGPEEIRACQKLRFNVFYEEMDARPESVRHFIGFDADEYDHLCDHLMVLNDQDVVGTYRLLPQERVGLKAGFYTQREFDIAPLIAAHRSRRFVELGRSCVLAPWRTKPVVELLWQGVWDYARKHHHDVMFGCASLEGSDPSVLSDQLSYLHHFHRASSEWTAAADRDFYVEMNTIPIHDLNARKVFKSLPPLIKGYLRLGASVGKGAVIDHQFNTTDVLIVLPVEHINPRYFARFGYPDIAPELSFTAHG